MEASGGEAAWISHAGIAMPIVLGDEGSGVVESVRRLQSSQTRGSCGISWAPDCGGCKYCALGSPALCVNAPTAGQAYGGGTRWTLDASSSMDLPAMPLFQKPLRSGPARAPLRRDSEQS